MEMTNTHSIVCTCLCEHYQIIIKSELTLRKKNESNILLFI